MIALTESPVQAAAQAENVWAGSGPAAAVGLWRRAAELAPMDAVIALKRVACLLDAGTADGDGAFRHLLALDPGGAGWAALGRYYHQSGHWALALRHLRRGAVATPLRAQVWNDLATVLAALKAPGATVAALRAAALVPDHAEYLFNMGCDRMELDRPALAVRLFTAVIRLEPALADAYARLGALAILQGAMDAAARSLRTALALNPVLPAALNGFGLLCSRLPPPGPARALHWYDRTLAVDEDNAEARLNRGLLRLQAGALAAGWADYAWRFASRGYVDRPLAAPRWRGAPLAGRRLFVWREQGVGDEILFAACFQGLSAFGGRVTVECDRRLVGLFCRRFPAITFVAAGGAAAATAAQQADYHTPAGSLPGICRRQLADFPPDGGPLDGGAQLQSDPALAARWRDRLAALPPGLRVGLAWKSGLVTTDRAAAYTRLADWAPLFAVPGVEVISLQYGDCAAEIAAAAFGARLHVWPDLDLKDDFESVAALIAGLDLVVTPATAAGELAAALGTPVWRLGVQDWTTLGTAVRPWFPAQRLYAPRPGEALSDIPARLSAELRLLAVAVLQVAPPVGDFTVAQQLYRDGDLDAAAALCAALIPVAGPADAGRCRHLAAVIANRQGRHADAVRLLAGMGAAVTTGPVLATLAAGYNGLGLAATAAEHPLAAVALYRRALALNPAERIAWINLAAAFSVACQATAARTALRRALTLVADDADAWANLALALEDLADDDGALAACRRAVAADSRHAVAHYNAALLLLRRGVLREGWAEYDWRFATPAFRDHARRFASRVWRGENLQGRRLLIWREQGVGDEIFLASCYAEAIRRAGQVIIQCDRRLVSLFSRSFPAARVIAADTSPPPHDVNAPAGSLPRWLRGELSRFPAVPGWLKVDPARAAVWRRRLDALGPGLKIGVAWRSGLITTRRAATYIDVLDWAPVFRLPGVQWINLQYGDCNEDLQRAQAALGTRLATWDDLNLKDDFESVAALMSQLDLVLSPAVSVGELAAAVGAPVWRLASPDWSGLGVAGARPWLPTMRVWSSRPGGSLRDVPIAMARALEEMARAPREMMRAPAPDVVDRLAQAVAAFNAGDIAAAAAGFAAVLAADSLSAAGWAGMGACLAETGDNRAAQTALRCALILRPADAAALTTYGNTLLDQGRATAAVAAHDRAVRLAPGLMLAWDNLGVALLALGRDRDAEASHRRVIAADRQAIGGWINLSAALRHQGKAGLARRALENALALAPADEDALANFTRLARVFSDRPLNDPWMARAFRYAPQSPTVLFNRGVGLLIEGRLAEGWAGYDQRYRARSLAAAAPTLPMPGWAGETLTGRRLLVWGEQGIGDQMMFAGMIPELLARAAAAGGGVTLAPEPRLAGLFRRSFPAATVVDSLNHPAAATADYHCGIGSLGGWLRPRLADFPPRPAFLIADPALAARWRERLAALPAGLRVGLAWRSGLLTGERRSEYCELSAWRDLLTMPGVTVVNLLYGAEAELAAAQPSPYVWPDLDLKNDLDGLAALMVNLDLVISPASSVGEMAASLGVASWRFGMKGDWTRLGASVRPWFPMQEQFLPHAGEGLDDVALRMIRRLEKLAQEPGDAR